MSGCYSGFYVFFKSTLPLQASSNELQFTVIKLGGLHFFACLFGGGFLFVRHLNDLQVNGIVDSVDGCFHSNCLEGSKKCINN